MTLSISNSLKILQVNSQILSSNWICEKFNFNLKLFIVFVSLQFTPYSSWSLFPETVTMSQRWIWIDSKDSFKRNALTYFLRSSFLVKANLSNKIVNKLPDIMHKNFKKTRHFLYRHCKIKTNLPSFLPFVWFQTKKVTVLVAAECW